LANPVRQHSTHRRPGIQDAQGSQGLVVIQTTTGVTRGIGCGRLRLLECVGGVRNALE